MRLKQLNLKICVWKPIEYVCHPIKQCTVRKKAVGAYSCTIFGQEYPVIMGMPGRPF